MQPNLKNQTSDLSLDGLEQLLDSNNAPETTSTTTSGKENSQDWTVEETARALGLSRGAVIRRLEDGIFQGYKVKRSYGYVWRVKALWQNDNEQRSEDDSTMDFAPNTASKKDSVESKNKSKDNNEQQIDRTDRMDRIDQNEFIEVFDADDYDARMLPSIPSASYKELIELRTKLQMTELQYQDAAGKLESANYKIGYLEARLEFSQEQLKMLTDSRRHEPWWQRWRQWFKSEA